VDFIAQNFKFENERYVTLKNCILTTLIAKKFDVKQTLCINPRQETLVVNLKPMKIKRI